MNNFTSYSRLTVRCCYNRIAPSQNFTRFVSISSKCRTQLHRISMTERQICMLNAKSIINRKFSNIATKFKKDIVTPTPSTSLFTNHSYEPDWRLRELHLTTCSDMWEDRPEGASFTVSYVDTLASRNQLDLRARLPTALVVEGSLGVDMRPLLEELARKGFRVIMPYLVGSDPTKAHSVMDRRRFSNLLGERASFLLDFIGAMNLKSIDVVVGHSFGCLPILTLASNMSLFKSIVLLCPIPGQKTPRWCSPVFISNLALICAKNALLRPIAYLWLRVWTLGRLPAVKQLSQSKSIVKQLLLVLQISLGVNYSSMLGFFELFRSRRNQLLYVYCEADAMVNVEDSLEYAEFLGIPTRSVDSSHDETVSHATDHQYRKLLCLSSSSHFPPQDNPQLCETIVNEIVLLNNSCKDE